MNLSVKWGRVEAHIIVLMNHWLKNRIMQIDGYSLDAQKSRMKVYADYNDFEIVGEYGDADKSGESIEDRVEFNRMVDDIKSGKDGVSYVLVFKLSRFGRNAADVLSSWSAIPGLRI